MTLGMLWKIVMNFRFVLVIVLMLDSFRLRLRA